MISPRANHDSLIAILFSLRILVVQSIQNMLNYVLPDDKQETRTSAFVSLPEPLRGFLRDATSNNMQGSPAEVWTTCDVEAHGRLSSWFSLAENDPLMPKGLSRRQRLLGFSLCLLAASLCLCLAVVFLPVVMTPFGLRKYVLLHSVGSVLLIGSFSFLWGPWNHLKGLFKRERLLFTFSFLLSLFLGLYAVIAWQSAIFAAIALFMQISLVVWLIVTIIPGGKTGLTALIRGGFWTVKSVGKSLPV